ncbi:glycosyltransferase involved in cell wall biosynthesis [Sphingomonas insulae]|uniref:glycosyltransferase family 4 protein n=1 Tax=Sphingomonas insulae TaxID=424800 RepID=UPI0013D2998F|nr:glycosyltransferase family 1 protein [Sphingomonas insulae]NIJ30803.1 glycosyltransferase involved in cell wall biosynthesis [Sphingomonas insulae]
MRIALVTDAWAPQVNGVVRTLTSIKRELEAQGHELLVVSPDRFASLPCPSYPEIRLALARRSTIGRLIAAFGAEAIHIATEGPLGLAARRWCLAERMRFTTAYHTQFPDYVAARTGVNAEWIWRYIRWFHTPAEAILTSTPSVDTVLRGHGLARLRRWGRGVDLATFSTDGPADQTIKALAGPILLYVGRVAVEKNIEAFLAAGTAGTKVVVGDGPARAWLAARYPEAHFLGPKFGDALAAAYRSADVLVFPSLTDTFGLVMIEALACGTPVAALPAPGPVDVLDATVGAIDRDLDGAIRRALTLDRATCAAYAARFTWANSAAQFLDSLAPIRTWSAQAA